MLKIYECTENPGLVFGPGGQNHFFLDGRFETEDEKLQEMLERMPNVTLVGGKEETPKDVEDFNKEELVAYLVANGIEKPKGNKTELLEQALAIRATKETPKAEETLEIPAAPVATDTLPASDEIPAAPADAPISDVPFNPAA